MRLKAVAIDNFRSIEKVTLRDLGGFNVFIGKNNSGKSNILTSLNAFFTCLGNGEVVCLDPPIGRPIDRFASEAPVEISATFALSPSDRDALIQEIISEAPQLTNAVEGLDPSHEISVRMRMSPSMPVYSIVRSVVLSREGSEGHGVERTLLSVGDAAAAELHQNKSDSIASSQEVKHLDHFARRFDQDDWERFRSSSKERHLPMSYLFRHLDVSGPVERTIGKLISDGSSYSDFQSAVRDLISQASDRSSELARKELTHSVETFSGQETTVPRYVLATLERIAQTKIHYLQDRRKAIGKDEANRLLALKVKRGGEEAMQNIRHTVASLLGVTIDAFQGENDAELDVDNFLVEVNGSGIREALRLILDVEFERPDVVMLEEPEMHLHPALETSMMRYLKQISERAQVFLTTHSTNFLDTADMQNVYLVSKLRSTTVQMLDFEEAEVLLPRELGLKLSSLFMFDRLVFVESPTDESVLREWSAKLGENLSQANVGFVSIGGARSLSYFAAENTLKFLTRRKVRLCFLIDRDEKGEDEVRKLKERMGEYAEIRVLKKRELENYLVVPRAIREFIGMKKGLAGNRNADELPTEEQLATALTEVAEELKEYTIAKRVEHALAKPAYPKCKLAPTDAGDAWLPNIRDELERQIGVMQAAKESATRVGDQARQALEEVWEEEKLNLVPGDVLIDTVCNRYGVRFKKERDAIRLARFFEPGEIDREMTTIIKDFSQIAAPMIEPQTQSGEEAPDRGALASVGSG